MSFTEQLKQGFAWGIGFFLALLAIVVAITLILLPFAAVNVAVSATKNG